MKYLCQNITRETMAFLRVRKLEVILMRREWKKWGGGISFRKMWGKKTEKGETLLHITTVQRAEIGVMQRAGPVIHFLQTTKKLSVWQQRFCLRSVMPGMKELSDRKRGKLKEMIMFFMNNSSRGRGGGCELTSMSQNSLVSTFGHAKTHLSFQHYIIYTAAVLVELTNKGLYFAKSISTGSWASGSNS